MKKMLALTISAVLVTACGSSDNSSNQEVITAPTLSEISGVWDDSYTSEGLTNTAYQVITEYGDFTWYDDIHDDGVDCYYKVSFTINDLGDGKFEVVDEDNDYFTFSASIANEQLTVSDGSNSFTYSDSGLQESDLVPLCEDLFTIDQYSAASSFNNKAAIERSINRLK